MTSTQYCDNIVIKNNLVTNGDVLSFSSDLTKERILSCAKDEFLLKGYNNANLREIAKNAKVTTGAMYNHFKNKEMLFNAIVADVATELLEMFEHAHCSLDHSFSFDHVNSDQAMVNGSMKIFEYMYEHLEEVKLIFFYSVGSGYENFIEKLIEIEESSSLESLKRENFEFSSINLFFVHVMATSGINNMLEAIKHNLNKDDALRYMEKIHRFYYAGVKEILGL